MIERVNAFDRAGRVLRVEARDRLEQEIREYSQQHGDAPVAVECVYLMLVNAQDELHIVQRAAKAENPWLWDKTVGGGVLAGDTADQTLLRESAEELGITTLIVGAAEYADRSGSTDLTRHAVVRPIAFDPWFRSERSAANGDRWVKRHRMTLYAGRYDGPVRFADGEAAGSRLMTLSDLRLALQHAPAEFTFDLHAIVANYGQQLGP